MSPSLEPITASWSWEQPLPAVLSVREWRALPPALRYEISDRGRALSRREFWSLLKLFMPEPEWGEGFGRECPDYCRMALSMGCDKDY